MPPTPRLRLPPVLIPVLLAGCAAPPEVAVDAAWVRLAAVKGNPAAAYFTVHGGAADATIIAVTSDVSIKSEMHRSMAAGRGGSMGVPGLATMTPLAGVAVPARTDVRFAPGGLHVMLYDMNPGIRPGGRAVLLTLSFADGTRLSRKANVLAAGDPAPE